eukprot:g20904.t1
MIAGTTLQAPSGDLVKDFMRLVIDPQTGRLCKDRIARAAAALEQDRAQTPWCQDMNVWQPYDPFSEIDDVYLSGDFRAPTARNIRLGPTPQTALARLLAESTCLPPERLSQVLLYVDDKIIGLRIHEDDMELMGLVLKALEVHEAEMFRRAGQYLAKSKLEAIVGNPSWCVDKRRDQLEQWQALLTKNFSPFGISPELKSSSKLLGAFLNLTKTPDQSLWDQMHERL